MDGSSWRYMRRSLAILAFSIAVVALFDLSIRRAPDTHQNLKEFSGIFHSSEVLPSGDVLIHLENYPGILIVSHKLIAHFDQTGFNSKLKAGQEVFLTIEKTRLSEVVPYSGTVVQVRSGTDIFLPIQATIDAYHLRANQARMGFIAFLFLGLLFVLPEMRGKKRAEVPVQR